MNVLSLSDTILVCWSGHFLGCLRSCSTGIWLAKGADASSAYAKIICTDNTYTTDAFVRGTCIKDASIEGILVRDACTRDIYSGYTYIRAANIGSTGASIRSTSVGDDCVKDAYVRDVYVRDTCIRDIGAIKDAGTVRNICFKDVAIIRGTCFRNADAIKNTCFRDELSQILELKWYNPTLKAGVSINWMGQHSIELEIGVRISWVRQRSNRLGTGIGASW